MSPPFVMGVPVLKMLHGGNVSAPGARWASFWTRAPLVAF